MPTSNVTQCADPYAGEAKESKGDPEVTALIREASDIAEEINRNTRHTSMAIDRIEGERPEEKTGEVGQGYTECVTGHLQRLIDDLRSTRGLGADNVDRLNKLV